MDLPETSKVVPSEAQEEQPEGAKSRGSWLDQKIGEIQYEEVVEPEEEILTKYQEIVRGSRFTLATTLLICVNGIIIGIETDHGDGSAGWQAVEVIFLILYCIELAVRLYAEGVRKSFKNDGWVQFDATVLIVALLDMIIISPVLESNGGGGGEAKQVAMVLRILRLAKLARLVRLLKFFKELWLLVASMGSAIKTLFWTFILLTIFIYVFAILFVKMLGNEVDDEDIQGWFGNMGNAMFTLFQIMTLESWAEIARAIWTTDRSFMLFVVLFYIAVSSFAIMNTVMAVIVEHTLDQAMDQKAELIKKAEEELKKQTEALLEIFLAADIDKGGTLCKGEFLAALESSATRKLLHQMDLGDDIGTLQAEEIGMLFDTIDVDRNKELSPQEFVNGIMQMRGGARARRVFEVQCCLIKMGNYNEKQMRQIHKTVCKLNGKAPTDPLVSPAPSPSARAGSKDKLPSAPPTPSKSSNSLAELEAKLDAGLAKNNQMLSDLEAKLDQGLEQVNQQINALVRVLPRPAG